MRTSPEAGKRVRWHHHAIACGAVLLVPTLLGYGFLVLFADAETLATASFAGIDGLTLSLFATLAAFSFYFSWIGLLVGVPLAVFALRRGLAGWLSALLAGIAVGQLITALLSLPLASVMGPFLALIYWLGLRLSVPDAFFR